MEVNVHTNSKAVQTMCRRPKKRYLTRGRMVYPSLTQPCASHYAPVTWTAFTDDNTHLGTYTGALPNHPLHTPGTQRIPASPLSPVLLQCLAAWEAPTLMLPTLARKYPSQLTAEQVQAPTE